MSRVSFLGSVFLLTFMCSFTKAQDPVGPAQPPAGAAAPSTAVAEPQAVAAANATNEALLKLITEMRTELSTLRSEVKAVKDGCVVIQHKSDAPESRDCPTCSKSGVQNCPTCTKTQRPSETNCNVNRDSQSNAQTQPKCSDEYCAEAYCPTQKVYTSWVTSHRLVVIDKPVPYIACEYREDPRTGCYRKYYVTKYRMEPHEVLVPYQKEVINETVGYEKLKVCIKEL